MWKNIYGLRVLRVIRQFILDNLFYLLNGATKGLLGITKMNYIEILTQSLDSIRTFRTRVLQGSAASGVASRKGWTRYATVHPTSPSSRTRPTQSGCASFCSSTTATSCSPTTSALRATSQSGKGRESAEYESCNGSRWNPTS